MMDPEVGDVDTVSFIKSSIVPRHLRQVRVLVHINTIIMKIEKDSGYN